MGVIKGYKIYKKGLINQFEGKHELNKVYVAPAIQFLKSGYCFCTELEDTFRYYDAMNSEVDICEVIGFGEVEKFEDTYYDYTIYVSDHIKLLRILSREEIIEYASKLVDYRLCRFIQGFRLTEDEINYLVSKNNSKQVQEYIDYYQLGDKDAFRRTRE